MFADRPTTSNPKRKPSTSVVPPLNHVPTTTSSPPPSLSANAHDVAPMDGEGVLWSEEPGGEVLDHMLARPHTSNPRYVEMSLRDTPRKDNASSAGSATYPPHGSNTAPSAAGAVCSTPNGGVTATTTTSSPSGASQTTDNNGEDPNGVLWASESTAIDPVLVARPHTSNPWMRRLFDSGDIPTEDWFHTTDVYPGSAPPPSSAAGGGGAPSRSRILWSSVSVEDWRLLARPHASNPGRLRCSAEELSKENNNDNSSGGGGEVLWAREQVLNDFLPSSSNTTTAQNVVATSPLLSAPPPPAVVAGSSSSLPSPSLDPEEWSRLQSLVQSQQLQMDRLVREMNDWRATAERQEHRLSILEAALIAVMANTTSSHHPPHHPHKHYYGSNSSSSNNNNADSPPSAAHARKEVPMSVEFSPSYSAAASVSSPPSNLQHQSVTSSVVSPATAVMEDVEEQLNTDLHLHRQTFTPPPSSCFTPKATTAIATAPPLEQNHHYSHHITTTTTTTVPHQLHTDPTAPVSSLALTTAAAATILPSNEPQPAEGVEGDDTFVIVEDNGDDVEPTLDGTEPVAASNNKKQPQRATQPALVRPYSACPATAHSRRAEQLRHAIISASVIQATEASSSSSSTNQAGSPLPSSSITTAATAPRTVTPQPPPSSLSGVRPQSAPSHRTTTSSPFLTPPTSLYTSQPTRINDLEINKQYEALLQGGDPFVRKSVFRAVYLQKAMELGMPMSNRELDRKLRAFGSGGVEFLTLDEFAVLYLHIAQW